MLMGCSKGSAVRLAPSSLLCAQTGRAWDWDCARGPVAARVGLGLCARASGRRGARAWDCARGPVSGRVGPFTDSGNPFLRSWALLVAVWAACLDYHLWG